MNAPICPVCNSPFMVGCNWYGPAPDHFTYTICARCDTKSSYDMEYRKKVIARLNKFEAMRKAKGGE